MKQLALIIIMGMLSMGIGLSANKERGDSPDVPTKDVALVLASGGARGLAYIGAIEELERRGYNITSVSGCSMGSLVGGMYAAGKLEEFKQFLYSIDNMQIISMMDLSISASYLVKGEKIMEALARIVPDVNIEDLPIPFAAVATDLYTGEEVVFREGSLLDAIRASISVPSLFKPYKIGHRTLIDGGLTNTFPLDLAIRSGHDILVGFDVNDIDAESINAYLSELHEINEDMSLYSRDNKMARDSIVTDTTMTLIDKIAEVGSSNKVYRQARKEASARRSELQSHGKELRVPVNADDNFYSILKRSISITNHVIANKMIEKCPPDVLVRMVMDEPNVKMAYARAREISEIGRDLMSNALDEYEARTSHMDEEEGVIVQEEED